MTDREQNVLALLYEERVDELTPAYLAYRLRIASSQAAELLDSLVRSGTLDLNFDTDGNISYGLPAAEKERLARQPAPNQPTEKPRASLYDDPALEAHFFGNTDFNPAADHHTQPNPAPHRTHQPPAPHYVSEDPNGYDGSLGASTGTTTPDYGYAQPQPGYQHQPHPQHHQHQPHHQHHHTAQYVAHPNHPHARVMPDSDYGRPNTQMVRYNHQSDGLIEVPHDANPGVAAFLSFLVVGGGQWYNGEYAKGAWMFIGCAVSWLFLMGWIVTFWSIIDAYAVAKERRSLPR